MLQASELMEAHVAECGELFGAMGRIPLEEQKTLFWEFSPCAKGAALDRVRRKSYTKNIRA